MIVIFFLGSYQICNFFYPLDDDVSINKWWLLKVDLYVLTIALCFIFMTLPQQQDKTLKSIEKFITYVGSGFTLSTFIDKRIFGIVSYTNIDLLMVVIVLIIAFFDVRKYNKSV